jgi:tRNA 2-thiouridine synthesizing protein A
VADKKLDVRGETCPVPLVEVRKALRKAAAGDVLEVVGTHPSSKKEIPSVEEEGDTWTIRIRR